MQRCRRCWRNCDVSCVVWFGLSKRIDCEKLTKEDAMITVQADPSRNLLTMKFSGHVGSHAVKRESVAILPALDTLQAGFSLLTDLSELESMEYTVAPYISKFMDLFSAKGVSRVVRVIPDARKDIGFKMMSYFHYDHKVHIITCETVEEANQVLAK